MRVSRNHVTNALIFFWLSIVAAASAMSADPPNLAQLTPEISAEDLRRHITYLASERTEGRFTGTEGERRATAYVAAMFHAMGLAPAGDNATFCQSFEFTAGVSLGGAISSRPTSLPHHCR
jgi:hypothetical protein